MARRVVKYVESEHVAGVRKALLQLLNPKEGTISTGSWMTLKSITDLLLGTEGRIYFEVEGHKYELRLREYLEDVEHDDTPYRAAEMLVRLIQRCNSPDNPEVFEHITARLKDDEGLDDELLDVEDVTEPTYHKGSEEFYIVTGQNGLYRVKVERIPDEV